MNGKVYFIGVLYKHRPMLLYDSNQSFGNIVLVMFLS